MQTSIVILTYNQLDYTKQCIESIRKFTEPNTYEIIIVDNYSTDGTREWLKQQKDIKTLLNSENKGFPKGCNQGIEESIGDNILLLNNDTVVTKNWLNNLLKCLYSSNDIGAVGPVTNSAAYYSIIPVNYKSIEEMHNFATQYNVSTAHKWEERLKLIGFCMLIKRELISNIGKLDEIFTPGNFEDDDYSVRIRKAGYRLMLCKDTFIHHYGSVSWKKDQNEYMNILNENENKFKEKWGITSKAYQIENELVNLIELPKENPIKVLHIGGGSGGTLLKIKHEYPFAEIYGIEKCIFSVEEANRFAYVTTNFNDEKIVKENFDIILFSVGTTKFDHSLLVFVKERLSYGGKFLAKIPNIGNYLLVHQLLKGQNPFDNMEVYSISQIEELTEKAGFELSISGVKSYINDDQEDIINQLSIIVGKDIRNILEANYFLVSCHLSNDQIKEIIVNFDIENENIYEVLEELNHYNTKQIIRTVKENYQSPASMLNQIAISNFGNGNHDHVLPYLKEALEVEVNDTDTLYNLAYVLNSYGEKKLAIDYLLQIKNPDEEVQNFVEELKRESLFRIQELTFLFRRLEFEIDYDETKQIIAYKLANNEIEESIIKDVIATSIINKVKILQIMATICYEESLHEQVLPYLQEAYDLDPNNEDTLFNLGYFLLEFGENELAERYLQQIQNPDEDVLDLLQVARGEIINE